MSEKWNQFDDDVKCGKIVFENESDKFIDNPKVGGSGGSADSDVFGKMIKPKYLKASYMSDGTAAERQKTIEDVLSVIKKFQDENVRPTPDGSLQSQIENYIWIEKSDLLRKLKAQIEAL